MDHVMDVDSEQIRTDWTKALRLDKKEDDPEALTINQLCIILGSENRTSILRWADKAVEEGRVESVKVFRRAGQGGRRWQKAYKLIKSED